MSAYLHKDSRIISVRIGSEASIRTFVALVQHGLAGEETTTCFTGKHIADNRG